MIVVWMGWALGLAAALSAVALAAEYALRLYGRSTRWLWATSLVGTLVLPVLAWLLAPVAPGPAVGASIGMPVTAAPLLGPAAAGASSSWPSWLMATLARSGPVAMGSWLLGSLVVLVVVGLSYRRLRRLRAGWREADVDGVGVLVSDGLGPAVVGLRRPRIVLPEWVLRQPTARRRLIVAHEAEHLAAGDARLLASAYGALALAPWNLPLWWQVRRLRLAAEMDCDARVLRRGADLRGYAGLLLEVGERFGPAAPAAAFAEPRSLLGRRLRALTAVPPARRGWRAAAGTLAALTVAALACVAPRPDRPGEVSPTEPIEAPRPVAIAATGADTPSLTPYTTAPELINRDAVTRGLRDSYPPLLREAGIGGTTLVSVLIDREGAVAETKVKTASGHAELDSAALRVARIMRFTPGRKDNEPVPVWVAVPIVFKTSQPAPHGADSAMKVVRRLAPPVAPPAPAPDAPSAQAPGAPPAPAQAESRLRQGPSFTPYTVAPELLNREEVTLALVREYPAALRKAGVGGQVGVWVLLGRDGSVQRTRIKTSSGHADLDSAALRVTRGMRFTPAKNGSQPVPVWLTLPIVFRSADVPLPATKPDTRTSAARDLLRDNYDGRPRLTDAVKPSERPVSGGDRKRATAIAAVTAATSVVVQH